MNDNKSIRPVLTEDEQKQVDEYFNFAAMSTEEKKPFLTEDDREIIGREKYGYWDDISVRDRISRGHFESGYNTAATKANAKIAELEKENESLKYWKAERDEEAEAERVSIAVAEIEIEKQEATKEEQKEWFSAGGMAERIIWKDKIEELESEVKKLEAWSKKQNDFIDKLGQENQKLREERDEFKFLLSKTENYVCDGCRVRGNWEHRCHGAECTCTNVICMEKQNRVTHEELMQIVNGQFKQTQSEKCNCEFPKYDGTVCTKCNLPY